MKTTEPIYKELTLNSPISVNSTWPGSERSQLNLTSISPTNPK